MPCASRHDLPGDAMPTIPEVAAWIPRGVLGLHFPALFDGPGDGAHRSGGRLRDAQSKDLPASDAGLTFELGHLPRLSLVDGDFDRLDRRIAGERDARDLLRA